MYFETTTVLAHLEEHFQDVIGDWFRHWASPEVRLDQISFENMPAGSRLDGEDGYQLNCANEAVAMFFSGMPTVTSELSTYLDKSVRHVLKVLFLKLSGGREIAERSLTNPLQLRLQFNNTELVMAFDKRLLPESLLGKMRDVPFTPPLDRQYTGEVSCHLGIPGIRSSLNEVSQLQVGQILLLDHKISEPLVMSLSGVPVARGYVGEFESKKAMVIEEVINEER